MPNKRLEKTREAYKDSKKINEVYYFPCERYSDHRFNDRDRCIFCDKHKSELKVFNA